MASRVTVVIPALNEAERIPRLLDSLARQTLRPDAVIVADAGSTDGTRERAASRGAVVVDGGMPAVGRNAGARAAVTDLILFLDADVALTDHALEMMVAEFGARGLSVAGAPIRPIERDSRFVFACEVVNFYLEMVQYTTPHAPGSCILVRRSVHQALGGFDETLALAEDHDYVERAAALGKFRLLRRAHVRVSMRRLAKEGLVTLAFKYLYCELQVMTGQKILDAPFDYEFAAFDEAGRRSPRTVAALRARMSVLAETLRSVSAEGVGTLRELADTEVNLATLERAFARLRTDDVRAVQRYVRVRSRSIRKGSKRSVALVRGMAGAVWRELMRSGRVI